MPALRSLLPNPYLMATVLSWGYNFVALKLLYEQMTAPAVSLVRFALMYLLLLGVCKVLGEKIEYDRKDAFALLWVGFVAMGVYMILFLEGMKGSSPAEGAILLATSPVFTAIFAVVMKQERFNGGAIVGAIVAFIGTALVIAAGAASSQGKLTSNILMLLSSVTWAYSVVLTKPLLAKYSPTQVLTLSMPGGLFVLVPYGAIATLNVRWGEFTTQSWLMLAHVAVLSGVVAFLGFYQGVRQIGPARAMMYQYFVPIFAAVFAYFSLNQTLRPLQAVGLAVVIAGVAFSSYSRMAAARVLEPTV